MADQIEGAENGSSNGTAVNLTRSQFHDQDKAAFLAEIPDVDADEKPAKPAPKKPAPVEDDIEDDATGEGDADEVDLDDDADDVELDDEDDAAADDDDGEPAKDADTSKRMDAVRRREQRSREQLAKERKSFEGERDAFVSEWKPKIEAAQSFEKLKAKGVNAYNALEVLQALGLPEAELEETGRAIYAASPKMAADPKNKEAIARAKRERERDDEVKELRRKLEEREAGEKKAAEAQKNQKAYEAYMDRVVKAAPAGTLAAHYLKESPAKTRTDLGRVAVKLAERDGKEPTAKQVYAAYEKVQAKRLRSYGLDPATIVKAAPVVVKKDPKAGEKTNAGKITVENGAKPDSKPDSPTRADIIAELESGDLS